MRHQVKHEKIMTVRAIAAAFITAMLIPALVFAGSTTNKGANPNGKPFIELGGQIIEVEGEVSSLQDQVDSLVGEVDSLEGRVTANEAAISSLQATSAGLQVQIDAIQITLGHPLERRTYRPLTWPFLAIVQAAQP